MTLSFARSPRSLLSSTPSLWPSSGALPPPPFVPQGGPPRPLHLPGTLCQSNYVGVLSQSVTSGLYPRDLRPISFLPSAQSNLLPAFTLHLSTLGLSAVSLSTSVSTLSPSSLTLHRAPRSTNHPFRVCADFFRKPFRFRASNPRFRPAST